MSRAAGSDGPALPDRLASPRRRRRLLAIAGVALLALACAVGCTSTVRPPQQPLVEPTTVLLSYDARHRALVLPRADRQWVEFSYGEMGWYARMEDRWYDVFDTVLWPTEGTLGRRELVAADVAAIRRRWHLVRFEPIEVERARVDRLCARLQQQFDAGRDRLVRNEIYDFDFVPVDEDFWCFFNCNDAVADWLEELGCDVSWVPIRVDLEVAR